MAGAERQIYVPATGLAALLTGALLALDRAGGPALGWGWCLALVCLVAGCACLAVAPALPAAYTGTLARLAEGRPRALHGLRAAVLVTAPVFGLGVAAYAALALIQALRSPGVGGRELDWRRASGTGLIGLAVVLALIEAGLSVSGDTILWSLLLAGSGLSLFWWLPDRKLDEARADGGRDRMFLTCLSAGLAVAAALFLLERTGLFVQAPRLMIGTAGAIAVLALVIGPRWLRSSRALDLERVQRALATERAELGGLLHDSVLQTLALIQDRAQDPSEVIALSRRQERELRSWLVGGPLLSAEARARSQPGCGWWQPRWKTPTA